MLDVRPASTARLSDMAKKEAVMPHLKSKNMSGIKEALISYTNSSRKNGMGIYGPFLNHFEALGASPTFFQAKMCVSEYA
jgi:hypothetical protein